jgi:hypothetical protein
VPGAGSLTTVSNTGQLSDTDTLCGHVTIHEYGLNFILRLQQIISTIGSSKPQVYNKLGRNASHPKWDEHVTHGPYQLLHANIVCAQVIIDGLNVDARHICQSMIWLKSNSVESPWTDLSYRTAYIIICEAHSNKHICRASSCDIIVTVNPF